MLGGKSLAPAWRFSGWESAGRCSQSVRCIYDFEKWDGNYTKSRNYERAIPWKLTLTAHNGQARNLNYILIKILRNFIFVGNFIYKALVIMVSTSSCASLNTVGWASKSQISEEYFEILRELREKSAVSRFFIFLEVKYTKAYLWWQTRKSKPQ